MNVAQGRAAQQENEKRRAVTELCASRSSVNAFRRAAGARTATSIRFAGMLVAAPLAG